MLSESERVDMINRRKLALESTGWEPVFTRWRHGGWYVSNLHYPSGAVATVAKCEDGKWHEVCGPRPYLECPGFKSRAEAVTNARDWALANWDRLYLEVFYEIHSRNL